MEYKKFLAILLAGVVSSNMNMIMAAPTVETNSIETNSTETNAETDSTKTNSTEADSTKTKSTETNSTKTNSTETDSTKTNSTETDSTKTNSTETNSTKTNSTETNSTETDSTETDSTETDSTETDSTKTNSTETNSTETNSTKTNSVETNTVETNSIVVNTVQKATKQSKPNKPTIEVSLGKSNRAKITIKGPKGAKIYYRIINPNEKDETMKDIKAVAKTLCPSSGSVEIRDSKNKIILAVATYDDKVYSDIAEYDTSTAVFVKGPQIEVEKDEADNGTNVRVSITTEEPGAEIYYTLDRTVPDEKSQKYIGPFTVTGKDTLITIEAITVKNGNKSIEEWRNIEFRKAKPVGIDPIPPTIEVRTLEGNDFYVIMKGQEFEDIYFTIVPSSQKDEMMKDIKK